jgi:type III restriction enzyme
MTPPGEAAEIVTVVEHKSFSNLYRDELNQEGLPLEVVDIDKVPRTTVTIYPDAKSKDLAALDLQIPRLGQAYTIIPELAGITFDEVRESAKRFKKLPLGKPEVAETKYEGRHLITNEVVERMTIKLPLLQDGMGAISFYREELEHATKIRGTHAQLAPLIQQFLEEVLFEEQVTLYDLRLTARLADADVREQVRATFVPLILKKIVHRQQRMEEAPAQSMCVWKPFQATHSERHPAVTARHTPFNLVPCNRQLEVAMAQFADDAEDVAAFAKNAGPQALRIDYLAPEGRRAIYTPDFITRKTDGHYLLVETKGQEDRDIAAKARAAVEWCKAASTKKVMWEYLYVREDIFARVSRKRIDELARACGPSLAELLDEAESPQLVLPFASPDVQRQAEQFAAFLDPKLLEMLPSRYRKAIEHAVTLFHFHENKEAVSFSPVFTPLLGPIDHAAEALLLERLQSDVPAAQADQNDFFEPDMSTAKKKSADFLAERAKTLKRLLVHRAPLMPTGVLVFCLDYAAKPSEPLGGVFKSVRTRFADIAQTDLRGLVQGMYDFRNTYIAHEKAELTDAAVTRTALRDWVTALWRLQSVRSHA